MKQKVSYLYVENPNGVQFGSMTELEAIQSGKQWIVPPPTPIYEADILRCNHCEKQILKNPHRKKNREWCWTCDQYVCDRCAGIKFIAGCTTIREIMEREATKIIRMSQ